MEERYFSDDAEFEELEIAEEELVDRYVRGELSRTDSDRFQKALAVSPRLMGRVQTARVFADHLRSTSASTSVRDAEPQRTFHEKRSWWSTLFGSATAPRFAVAFSILLVLIGGVALLVGWLRLREESRQLAARQGAIEQRQRELDKLAADLKSQMDQLANRTPTPTPSETPLPKQVDQPSPAQSQSILAFSLSPGALRSDSTEKKDFRIAHETSTVEITLRFADTSYPSYQATVVSVDDNRRVFKSGALKLRGSSSAGILTISIPAKTLRPGDYSIALVGRTPSGATEGVEDYSFRITN